MSRTRLAYPPRVGQKVLSAQAGYPQGHFQGAFDPGMGRGYRGGNQVLVPANTPEMILVNHGQTDGFFRWKLRLYAVPVDPADVVADTAYFVRVTSYAKYENDQIPQETEVALNSGQTLYGPGRSIAVYVENPTDIDIYVHYELDEATPGLSGYTTTEHLELDAGTPVDLTIPNNLNSFQVFSVTGGPGFTVRGYDLNSNLVFEDVLSAGTSASVSFVPSLRYTLEAGAGAGIRCVILYQCVG